MALPYNKPGVTITEVLSPNLPVNTLSGASVGAFIGIADRGPTAVVGGNVVGVPTLVSNWDEFVNTFSFGAVTNIFSPSIFGTTPNPNFLGTATSDLKNAMYSFFANGGTNAYVTRKVNTGAAQASATIADNQGNTTLNLGSATDATVKTTLVSASNATSILVATTTGIVFGQTVAGTNVAPDATVSSITSVVATSKTGTASSNSATVTIATASVAVGQVVSGSTSIPTGTYVTAIGTGSITISATTTAALTVSDTLSFTLNTLSLSSPNTAAVIAGTTLSFDTNYLTVTVATNAVTVYAPANSTFNDAVVGNVVSFTGINTTSATANTLLASSNSFIITSTFGGGVGMTLAYSGAAISGSILQTSGTVVVNGVKPGAGSLKISANSHGTWGNNVWVGITPNQTPNYFDLTVYYGVSYTLTASTATPANLKRNDIVEIIPQLSLNPSDSRYFANVINSNWITVTDVTSGTPTNPTTRVPVFTSAWSTSAANITASSKGTFKWASNGTVATTSAIRLGGYGVSVSFTPSTYGAAGAAAVATSSAGTAWSTTAAVTAYVTGVAGTVGTGDPTTTLAQLDSVTNQLTINYPNVFDTTSLEALLTYADSRGDSFVVIDPGTTFTTATAITTALDGLQLDSTNFGAVYFPNLVYSDPASSVAGKTITVAPGGAVVATYCSTDTNKGAFKSPAGISTAIPHAVTASSLSSSDFDTIAAALTNVNVIRNVPGYGTCIMGARSIASNFSDKYISVRRTLSYLEYTLKANTQFAIFEPNDQNLWSNINAVVSGLLNDYWAKGGLAGATAREAFYVKCDSTINTPTTIAAGELHIEVGVALQRPAEFVIIKIGQINGGTTVTTTI